MKQALLLSLLLFVLSSGGSYLAFSKMRGDAGVGGLTLNGGSIVESEVPEAAQESRIVIAPEAPKTEQCPLNGKMYTKPEQASWATRRPLAVMIENHMESRPQSGLSSADIVYEAVVEGGITRFMAMYYCEAQARDVLLAPVRSARQAFVDWASEYNFPLYAHVGGANGEDTDPRVRALENIGDYGWNLNNDLNQFSIGYPTFVRNYDRIPGKEIATEHTMESSTERLWAVAEKRGWTNMSPSKTVKKKEVTGTDWTTAFTPWQFADDAVAGSRGTIKNISHEFWSGYKDFAISWAYDSASNSYKRTMAGESHIDLNTNKPLVFKNVLVLTMKELSAVDVHKHNYIATIGTGKGTLFQNGQAIQVTWTKKDRVGRTIITDEKGKQVSFVRGPIWISIVPQNTPVTF